MFETKNINPSQPDRAELLTNILEKHKIWDKKRNGFRNKKSEEIFEEVFLGFFVAWMSDSFRFAHKGNLCFLPLEKNTLLLIPPNKKITAYINIDKGDYAIFKDNLFDGIYIDYRKMKSCPLCHIKDFIKLNYRQMGGTPTLLNKILKIKDNHSHCAGISISSFEKMVKQKIEENPRLGIAFGGIPFLLKCPPALIAEISLKYFSEFDSPKTFSSILNDLMTSLMIVFLGSKCSLDSLVTNHSLIIKENGNKYESRSEFDGIGYKDNSTNKKVLILELTTLYETAFHKSWADVSQKQLPKHFNMKVKKFNEIDYILDEKKAKLKFIYINLQKFNEEMKKSLEYGVIKYNKNFYPICLKESYTYLKTGIEDGSLQFYNLYKVFRKKFEEFKKLLLQSLSGF